MNAFPQTSRVHASIVAPETGAEPGPGIPTSHPLAAILDTLHRGSRFLVCSHTRPDGDAVGSMLALGMVIEQMGKAAHLVTADRVPIQYWQLPGADSIHTMPYIRGRYDAAILLECDSLERTRLRGLEELFVVNIDHHITGVEFGHLNWIDHSAASVGEMVYQLARAAGIGYYAAALSFYDNFLSPGRNVIFPRNTRIVIETTPLRAPVLKPGESSEHP